MPLWEVKNKEDMSPFVLAAELGFQEIFEHILERSKQVQWKYGPVTCAVYPLEDFDLALGASEGALEATARMMMALIP